MWSRIDGDQSLALNPQSKNSRKCFHKLLVSLFPAPSEIRIQSLWVVGISIAAFEQPRLIFSRHRQLANYCTDATALLREHFDIESHRNRYQKRQKTSNHSILLCNSSKATQASSHGASGSPCRLGKKHKTAGRKRIHRSCWSLVQQHNRPIRPLCSLQQPDTAHLDNPPGCLLLPHPLGCPYHLRNYTSHRLPGHSLPLEYPNYHHNHDGG